MASCAPGLPPTTYGAGKNLFTNPFISFFMRNLGAYRVDRRLRFELYKDVLKEYSTVLLEHGYHSLFFPGGTRSRSSVVEQQLKLGLLGTTVTAYKNLVREGKPNKRLYIVPATINYRLVLEAETLIDDYLAETGKSRYIITDDEFSRIGRIVEFFRKILAHEGSVIVRFGRPLDPFGNDITDDGESIDRAGRIVDPASYVRGADGEVTDDDQRDAEYTRALGRRLVAGLPEAHRVPLDAAARARALRRARAAAPARATSIACCASPSRNVPVETALAGARAAARAGSPRIPSGAPSIRSYVAPDRRREARRRRARAVDLSHAPGRRAQRRRARARRQEAHLLLPEPHRAHPGGGSS